MVLDGIEVRIRHKLSCTTTFDVFIVSRFAVAFYGSSSHPQLVALIAQVSCKYFQRCFYIDVYFSKISNIQPVLHTLQFLSLLTGTHYCSIIFNFLHYISALNPQNQYGIGIFSYQHHLLTMVTAAKPSQLQSSFLVFLFHFKS